MFPLPEVSAELQKFVLVELYTDKLDEASPRNTALREQLTGSITNPIYVVLTPGGEVVKTLQPVELSADEMITFLKAARAQAARSARQ